MIAALEDDLLTSPWAEEQDGAIALWLANGEATNPLVQIDQEEVMQQRGVPQVVRRR